MASRLIDVAKLAGVSTSTVSYVLSGARPISQATRQRVISAIAELGYRPHAGARSIRRKSLNLIAVVLPLVTEQQHAMLMLFVLAVDKAVRQRGANVLLLSAEDGVEEIARVVSSAQVDGLIATEVPERDRRIALLTSLNFPVVLIGSPPQSGDLVHVDLDLHASGAACFDYLFSLGHRHIGYLGHSVRLLGNETGYERRALEGVLHSMESNAVAPIWSPMESGVLGVEAALGSLFTQDPLLSGLIVYNERMLSLVFERLKKQGLDIPGSVSIVAISPETEARQTVPPVSYVALPVTELGQVAVELLMDQINGNKVPMSNLLAPHLISGYSAQPVIV